MKRSEFMKLMLQKKMEESEEKRQTQNDLREYMMKKSVDARLKRQEYNYKRKLDKQDEARETTRDRQKDRAALEDPTAKWKGTAKKEARRSMGMDSKKPSYAQRIKEKRKQKLGEAEVVDIAEDEIMVSENVKKHFWSRGVNTPISDETKQLSESLKTINDITAFFDEIGSHRNKLGAENVGALEDYILNAVIPQMSLPQQKQLEDQGYIELD